MGKPLWERGAVRPRRRVGAARARQGLTLVELMVTSCVMAVALLGFSQAVGASARSVDVARERTLAVEAARAIVERMRGETFAQLFARYNALAADDPGGAGSAPGANFAISGLAAQSGDADGLPGSIEFPVQSGAPGVLREDVDDPDLGMPRDLDGDNAIDAADHAADYALLPVVVRVRWRGRAGNSSTELRAVLGGL